MINFLNLILAKSDNSIFIFLFIALLVNAPIEDKPTVPNTLGAIDLTNGNAILIKEPIPSPAKIFCFFLESVNLYLINPLSNKLLN